MQREEVLVADSNTIHSLCISMCFQKVHRKDIKNGELWLVLSKQSDKHWTCDHYIAMAGGKANTSQLVVIVQAVFHSRFRDLIWLHFTEGGQMFQHTNRDLFWGLVVLISTTFGLCFKHTCSGGRNGHLMI